MKIPIPMFRVLNPVVKAVLRSPLHPVLSKNVMLISFTGRRSGRRLTTPVSYTREAEMVRCFTDKETKWWRNLRGGAAVTLHLAGESSEGHADVVVDDPKRVADALRGFLGRVPRDAVYYDVRLDSDNRPDAGDLERAAQRTVFVEIHLTGAADPRAA